MESYDFKNKLDQINKVKEGFNICHGFGENAGDCRVCPYDTGDLDLSCGDILAQDINALIEDLSERIKAES